MQECDRLKKLIVGPEFLVHAISDRDWLGLCVAGEMNAGDLVSLNIVNVDAALENLESALPAEDDGIQHIRPPC